MGRQIKRTPEWYKRIFDEEMREGREVLNMNGEVLPLEEGEYFTQCYSSDDPAREVLPYSWFLSNKNGNVITVYPSKKLEWITKIDDGNGYYKYKYRHPTTNKIKNIMVHNLVALVYGAKRFGKVDKLLKEKDVYAFGNINDPLNVNGHHVISQKEKDNMFNPDNIELVTSQTHKVLHSAPKEGATEEERATYVKKIGDIASKEAPGKIVVFCVDGDKKYVDAVNSIQISKEALDQIQAMVNACYNVLDAKIKD